MCDGHALVQMKLAPTAVVVQTVRYVGLLLHFAKRNTGPDGVHGSRRNEERVAGPGFHPVQQLHDLAADGRSAQALPGDFLAKSHGNPGSRCSAQDMPHLRLAAGVLMNPGELVAGMNLHGEIFLGEDEFHQKRQGLFAREPNFADQASVAGIPGRKVQRAPDFLFELGVEPNRGLWHRYF